MRLLVSCLLIAALLASPALAAEPGLLDQLRPALGDIAAVAIVALLTWAAQRFKAWTGIEIEARHREALQSALANAARMMIAGGTDPDYMRAVDYVERSVPDALAHLGVAGRDRIRELLAPHVAALKPSASPGLARG